MKDIYIIKTHSNTIPAKIIKKLTKYEYSHVLLSLDCEFDNMYSFGRKTVNNPFNGGFIIESKNGKFYKKFKNTKCCITKLSITNKQYYDLNKIIKMFKSNDNLKYDYLGILLRYINIDVKFNNKYVCSQFVAEVLNNSNIYNFNKKIELVRPKDFDNIKNGKIIYEGLMCDIK